MKRVPWFLGLAAAAVMAGAALADERVLIVPFNVLNVPTAQQWIGTGVQENLVADLGRTGNFDPINFRGQVIVEDNATAARLARQANAPLAIRGSAQVVGENVRLTAQLIDSRSGDTLRTTLVTGSTGDLLKLEDELASQLRGTTAAAANPPAGMPVTPTYVPAAQPPVIAISQPQPAYGPSYPYGYNYPYGFNYPYAYNYPFGFYPLVLYPVTPGNRGHGRGRGGGGRESGGGGVIVRNGGGGFNPSGLPVPNNNVLPIPTNNVLPVPTNNVLPVPTSNVLPLPTTHGTLIPTISPLTPRASAGQVTRASRPPWVVN